MRDLTREHRAQGNGHLEPQAGVDLARDLTDAELPARGAEDVGPSGTGWGQAERPPAAERLHAQPDVISAVREALLISQRDRIAARMVNAVLGAAKMLDPITRIVMARVLALGAMVAATALTAYTLALTTSWERVAVCGLFLCLCSVLIRKGQAS